MRSSNGTPFKVRFNLGKGKDRYMKWQVTMPSGRKLHFDPSEVCINMIDAKLRNNPQTADKIFNGAHKTVCAWVECMEIEIVKKTENEHFNTEVSYNPRVNPFWISEDKNVDNQTYSHIVSSDRKLFICKELEL